MCLKGISSISLFLLFIFNLNLNYLNAGQNQHATAKPQAIITAPIAGSELGDEVIIQGTADDVNFKEYRLYYCLGNCPEQWNLITIGSNRKIGDTLYIQVFMTLIILILLFLKTEIAIQ